MPDFLEIMRLIRTGNLEKLPRCLNLARFHGMKPIWARPTVTIPSDAGFPPRARKRRETRVAWSVC